MKRITGVALFLAGFCFATTGTNESAFAATFTVNTLGNEPDENPGDGLAEDINGDTPLRAAIEEANTTAARDRIDFEFDLTGVINVYDGESLETNMEITEDLTIFGSAGVVWPTKLTITSSASTRVFSVAAGTDVLMTDLTFADCYVAVDGAVILNQGVLLIDQCIFLNNYTDGSGGAIATDHDDGSLWITRSRFEGNMAALDGGAICTDDDFHIRDCKLIRTLRSRLGQRCLCLRIRTRLRFSATRSLPIKERLAKFEVLRGQMLARMDRIQKRIEATLLPHQWERLQEIRVQARISRYGLSVALADNSLARVLELSDEQKQKLPRVAQERARKLDEEIAELRRKARREILKEVLTKEQIKEFDDLLGEQFEPTRPSRAGSGTRARSGSKGRF